VDSARVATAALKHCASCEELAHVAPYIAHLDVTATGCDDARFNARCQGQLGAISSAKEARLALATFALLPGSKLQLMTIEAVLKR
jgi:hypothetical protein